MPGVYENLARACPAAWGRMNRKLRGRSYGFIDYKHPHRHRPFLAFPLSVQAREKGAKKSRQAGVSENEVSEVLWFMDLNTVNVVYTFPSPKQVEDFSNTRVRPAIMESPRLVHKAGAIQNVGLRQFGNSHLFLRSATNPNLGEGVDADMVVFDEIDRMRRNIMVVFQEALSASKFGYIRSLSTPSLPHRGIDELWQKSTQYHWFVKCEACGKEQIMRFPDNIIELKSVPAYEKTVPKGSYAFACSHCHSTKLNRWDGRWVAKYASRDPVCFHINQLMCCWISADEIMQKKRDYRFPQLFWNYVLGETYLGNSLLLQRPMLERQILTDLKPSGYREKYHRKVSVGIDWGQLNWAVVKAERDNGAKEVIGLFVVEDTSEPLASARELAKLIKPFRPDIIVCDWGYGKDRTAQMLKDYPGRVYGCHYLDNGRQVEPNFVENSHTVQVDRTAWLKGMTHEVRDGGVFFPDYEHLALLDLYFKQMTALAVILEEDEKGNITERVDSVGEDHFAHATGYADMGLAKKGLGGGGFSFDFLT